MNYRYEGKMFDSAEEAAEAAGVTPLSDGGWRHGEDVYSAHEYDFESALGWAGVETRRRVTCMIEARIPVSREAWLPAGPTWEQEEELDTDALADVIDGLEPGDWDGADWEVGDAYYIEVEEL